MVLSRREHKGIDLVSENHVQELSQVRFLVRSESDSATNYEVSWIGKKWICTCPDYRRKQKRCKHIHAVSYYLAVKAFIPALKSDPEAQRLCPKCHSSEIAFHCWRYNKNGSAKRYRCKNCRKTFSDRNGFEGMKNQAKIIATALDLYFRGLSLRKISEHFETLYQVKVSYTSVYYWLSKYVEIVENLAPCSPLKTGERWAADETLVRLKGRHIYLWGLLDRETKVLIAEHISARRSSDDASILFKKGLEETKHSRNQVSELITDGLPSYAESVNRELRNRTRPLIHVQGPLLTGKINNNQMERMMGTIKERTKLTMHFHNEPGAKLFSKGFRTHYNYVRGHMALDGKTPAQAAGLSEKKLSWLDLISKAQEKRRHQHRN
jgi:transposase-like protein